ncbi:MAG TPA: cation transporting ATPase C-terminal domain-containing protein, partial [Actinomycetes bacterium]
GDANAGPEVAATMLLTTLSLFHVAAGLLARDQRNTIFDRAAVPGTTQLRRYGIALLAIIVVTNIGFLQRIFGTVELNLSPVSICIGLALTLVVVESSSSWSSASAAANGSRRHPNLPPLPPRETACSSWYDTPTPVTSGPGQALTACGPCRRAGSSRPTGWSSASRTTRSSASCAAPPSAATRRSSRWRGRDRLDPLVHNGEITLNR